MTDRDKPVEILAGLQRQLSQAVTIMTQAHEQAARLAAAGHPDEARIALRSIRDLLQTWLRVLDDHDQVLATGPRRPEGPPSSLN